MARICAVEFLTLIILFLRFGFASSALEPFVSLRSNREKDEAVFERPKFIDQEHCAYVNLRYRQLDGTCNHRKGYGSINRAVKRYLKPHYSDPYGQDSPRMYSVLGRKYPLPSPRLVSMHLNPDRSKPSKFTLLLMQFGQMIDHDVTMAPTVAEDDKSLKCCGVPKSSRSSDCFSIRIPRNDTVFTKCMEFVRSRAACDKDGYIMRPREQTNSLTSFLDASAIYGNDWGTMNKLRTQDGTGALLRTRNIKGKLRLPKDPNGGCLITKDPLSYCQLAGDPRVNEQPGLASLHLVFHLQHNVIVRSLVKARFRQRGVKPDPKSVAIYIRNASAKMKELLFQETRKIMSAILQKITYCDWIPLVLGPRLVKKYKLKCKASSQHDPNIDPRAANVFLTAAFRFGHSLIPNEILVDYRKKPLKSMFNVPDASLFHFESIMYGLCVGNMSRAFDRFVSESVTSSLFQTSNKSLDLIALNIQRGRDHGIPSYHHWRKYYKLGSFKGPRQFGSKSVAQTLRKLFKSPKDIDLYTAGLLEKPVPGGIVGATFGNILAHQFSDIKYGDAYFFSHTKRPQCFTKAQRNAIMDVDIAQILCTASTMSFIQRNPFLEMSAPSNPLVQCDHLPPLDLTPWLEIVNYMSV